MDGGLTSNSQFTLSEAYRVLRLSVTLVCDLKYISSHSKFMWAYTHSSAVYSLWNSPPPILKTATLNTATNRLSTSLWFSPCTCLIVTSREFLDCHVTGAPCEGAVCEYDHYLEIVFYCACEHRLYTDIRLWNWKHFLTWFSQFFLRCL